jgi:hypothetical protein
MKTETWTVLAAMKHFVGRAWSVTDAAGKVAQIMGGPRTGEAVRRLWYDYRNGKIFNEIISMREGEVKRREVSARNP